MGYSPTIFTSLIVSGAFTLALLYAGWHVSARPVPLDDDESGKALTARYCTGCHTYPDPALLDRGTWLEKVFPVMRRYLGLDLLSQKDSSFYGDYGISEFPTQPMMTEDEWFEIASYIIDHAPLKLPKLDRHDIRLPTPLFRAVTPAYTIEMPLTTMVRIDTLRKVIVTGSNHGWLSISDYGGVLIDSVFIGGPPSWLHFNKDAWYVTNMGRLNPHDSALGSLERVEWKSPGKHRITRMLDTLRRPVHVIIHDVNEDGTPDAIVCEYGNVVGRYGWYELPKKGKKAVYHEFDVSPGAIRTELADFNGDNKLDIAVLMAQNRERISIYLNNGKGDYKMTTPLNFPPSYGASSFTVTDVNRDQKPDFIVSFGDNGDYEDPPFKPYHGCSVYTNDGKGAFTQSQHFPANGCYGCKVIDLNNDRIPEVITMSYFADFSLDPGESLLLWQTNSSGEYVPHAIEGATLGRWVVWDAADLTGNGVMDLVVGNMAIGPGRVPPDLSAQWVKKGIPYMIFLNASR